MAFPTGWLCRAALVVQHGQVTADQTAFPVLITEASFATNCPEILTTGDPHAAQSDGGDLRFSTDSAGATQIACEVVRWSQNATFSSARAEIHVPRDVLTGSDVTIYVWWSGGGGLSQPAANASFGANAVWDTNYSLVQHFPNGSTLSVADSTGKNSPIAVGPPGAVDGSTAGVIDGYAFFNVGPYVHTADVAALQLEYSDSFTFEFWILFTDTGTRMVFEKMDGSSTFRGYQVFVSGGQINFALLSNNAGAVDMDVHINSTINDGTWKHIVFTYSGNHLASGVTAYLNGSSTATTTGDNNLGANTIANSQEFNIGRRRSSNSLLLAADLDELRISKGIARSASWISTAYNNEHSPSTFIVAGTRTDVTPSGGPAPQYTRRILSGGIPTQSGGLL